MSITDTKLRPHMIVTYIKRPAPGQNTSVKEWGKIGEYAVEEQVIFVERVKNRNLIESHVIIDVMKAKVIKNRFIDANDEEILKHFLQKYSDDAQRAISVWMQRNLLRTGELPTGTTDEQEAPTAEAVVSHNE